MTPKQIIINFIQSRLDANDDMEMLEAKEKAIENMKQWGREMCDKQKDECVMAVSLHGNEDVELSCENAPYPKELL